MIRGVMIALVLPGAVEIESSSALTVDEFV